MRARLVRLLLAFIALAAIPAQAQISFRAASGDTAAGITPLFRTAASAATSGATLAINNTTSNGTNMVLVASIAVTPSSVAITPPSGWTLVRRLDNPGPTSNSLAVYYRVKIAAGGEPASYVWDVSGATFAVGGIQVFNDVDTTNPIDAENGQSTPSSLTHTAPGVTTSTANAMLVASHAYASSRSWEPSSGMTETFDRPSGAKSGIGLTIEGSRMLQAVAGASGDKTATAAQYPDAGNAHLLALRPAPAGLTILHPAGTVSGDLMITAIAFNNATATITPPSGWTLVRRIDNHAANSNSLVLYRKVADVGNPSFYTWHIAGGAFLVGGIQSFSGVDPFNPIDAENGQSTPSSTAHDTPSITTTEANTMLVTAHTYASSQNWTAQVGLTEAFDRRSGFAGDTGQSITGTYQLQALPGPSGAKRSTAATSADIGNTHILALRPLTNTGVAQMYFIHTDHLNTPRLITNGAGQAVWRWDQADPFGGNVPNENPSGLGTFTCNLRLPGQYFDKETNLHYNYFRDYDPGIGRYAQSDPIGVLGLLRRQKVLIDEQDPFEQFLIAAVPELRGLRQNTYRYRTAQDDMLVAAGVNLYAYVGNNPLGFVDPFGLQGTPGTTIVDKVPLPGGTSGGYYDPGSNPPPDPATEAENRVGRFLLWCTRRTPYLFIVSPIQTGCDNWIEQCGNSPPRIYQRNFQPSAPRN